MANQIIGRVIAVSEIETVPSTQGKEPFQKRKLFMDCTRFDTLTGERGYENTPLLEFGGKGLEKLNELVAKGLKKGDAVKVSFDVQGTKFKNRTTGKTDVYTAVRPYHIELYVPQGWQPAEGQQTAASQLSQKPAQPAGEFVHDTYFDGHQPQQQAPMAQSPFVEDKNEDLPF